MHFSKMHFQIDMKMIWKFCKFLAGSFSAVSKRNFAKKYAFDSIFQALQDVHPFAPLQSQNFRKKSVWKNSNFREISAKKLQMSQNLQNFKFCQNSKISAWESGRFWKMLLNAYFLAKIGADTAENEQHFAEILPTDALWRLRLGAPSVAYPTTPPSTPRSCSSTTCPGTTRGPRKRTFVRRG